MNLSPRCYVRFPRSPLCRRQHLVARRQHLVARRQHLVARRTKPTPPSDPTIQQLSNPKLQTIIKSNFPSSQFCFAYGSKVLHQLNNLPDPSTMTDIVFVTKDTVSWHEENFARNKRHYSHLMRLIGLGGVSAVQNLRPYCIFNPYVEVDGLLLKYGVISEGHLYKDLQNWDTLYIAGRLHKPVLVLHQDPTFNMAYIKHNLRSALHTALVLLPEKFSDLQLFSVISHISYRSDIRSSLKLEHPQKVRNIVQPNIPYFRLLYQEVIDASPFIERTDYGYLQSAKTEKTLLLLEKFLPNKLLHLPEGKINPKSRVMLFDKNVDPKNQLCRKVMSGDLRFVEEQLRLIVQYPSIYQTLKGVLTAGVGKSLKYSFAKIRKSRTKGTAPKVPAVVYDTSGTVMTTEYNVDNSIRSPAQKRNSKLMLLATFICILWMLRMNAEIRRKAGTEGSDAQGSDFTIY